MLKKSRWVALLAFLAASAAPAAGQGLDTLGTRAAGMSAFVAVADDASAVAWNPAGLVSGPLFNITLDLGRASTIPDGPPTSPGGSLTSGRAGRQRGTLIALGTLPFGLAYYRLASAAAGAAAPAVSGTPDRQDGHVVVRTLVTDHLGATVQQSVGEYLTLGATLKLVRGSVGVVSGPAASWEAAIERAEGLERQGSTRGDVDVGAMLASGRLRLGVVMRNATSPSFGDAEVGGAVATLNRQARLGVAWADGWPGTPHTIVAFDADVTRVSGSTGERRDVAAGIERWGRSRRVGVRGGVRASTVGEARPVASVGGSYAVRAGTFVDVFVARGAAEARGWGMGVRLSY